MKKQLFLCTTIFWTLFSWGQINSLPSTESFNALFTTGIDVEFIPNWTGNDVQASARIFRDDIDFNSAPAAMSIIPTSSFNGDVRISLDLTAFSDVSLELQAKSVLNGTGDRSAVLTIDTSIDGGTTWIGNTVAGTFPNTTQANFTTVNYNLPAAANNESNVVVRLSVTRSSGNGTTAKLVIDDVLFSESTSSSVLVHYWNFNDNSSEAAITTVSQSLVSGATLNAIPGGTSVIDFAGGTGQNFDVDNLNARNGDAAGTHLRFNDPIGGALRFDLPTTGFEDVIVMFATRRSGQGAGTQLWSYSIDGVNFIPFQSVTTFNANPELITFDFSAIGTINDNQNFSLIVEFEEGAGGTGGNNRFDNFTLDANPIGSTPLIISSAVSLSFTQYLGSPSNEETLTVSGINLTDDITINAPTNFEISFTPGGTFSSNLSITQVSGSVIDTDVFVRLNNNATGPSSGQLIISSTNADDVIVNLDGNTQELNITNPTPFVLNSGNYMFTEWDENNPAGTYPANMVFWTHATTDPDIDTDFLEDWNCLYNLTNRSRINGEGADGFSFVNTGNAQYSGVCDGSDPTQNSGATIENGRSGAAVLALNTTNRADIEVLWTARTIAENNRVYALRMQYRIGDGNGNPNVDWQDFDTPLEYISGPTGDFEDFAVQLPLECNDQSLVQLRWVYYYISGSGSRAQIALDDIMIEGVPLSIDDFEYYNKFTIYPNPSNDIVYFSEIADVTIYDITGKILLTAKNATKINVESLASGVYLIRNEKGQILKLVKK